MLCSELLGKSACYKLKLVGILGEAERRGVNYGSGDGTVKYGDGGAEDGVKYVCSDSTQAGG